MRKIPISKLKGWRCVFETKKGMRYTITFCALRKEEVIKKIKKGKYDYLFRLPEETEKPSKDKLISIVNADDYYREMFK